MDQLERDIAILRKLLNSELFLKKFPVIERVSVDKYGQYIDIVMIPIDIKEYFKAHDSISRYVFELKRAAGVESRTMLYP